jgi:hypothetical protein
MTPTKTAGPGDVPAPTSFSSHTVDGLKIEFRPRPVWEPYVEAVLARQRQGLDAPATVTTSVRKTGGNPATLVRAGRSVGTPRGGGARQ